MSRTILLGKKGRTIKVDFGAFPTGSRQPVSLLYHGELLLHQQPATSHVFISFQKDVQSAIPGREPQASSCTFTGWDGMGRRTTDPQQVGVSGEGERVGAEALSS